RPRCLRRRGRPHGAREPARREGTRARSGGRPRARAGALPAALPARRPAVRVRAVGAPVGGGVAERAHPRHGGRRIGRDARGRRAVREGCRPARELRAMTSVRTETDAGVRSVILARPAEYNTITPALRDELAAAIDDADADRAVHVILLRADGPAFCAGYGLDWSTVAQATEESRERRWDSVGDLRMMGKFVDVYM